MQSVTAILVSTNLRLRILVNSAGLWSWTASEGEIGDRINEGWFGSPNDPLAKPAING